VFHSVKNPHLETFEIEPEQTATASIIWMHGLGADAGDFYSVVPQLGLPPEPSVRFVFPNAPRIPVTINMGMMMRAWYDVTGFERSDQDEPRIRQSATLINEVVARELDRGITPGQIVLAGFSQGGAMALFAGLRQQESLGGLICLSGYLLLDEELESIVQAGGPSPPIFQAHGTGDPVVPYTTGLRSRDRLAAAGYGVEWREYSMGHQVCLEEIRDISAWLTRVLGAAQPGPRPAVAPVK
jgi:phospholipase/carboxylesterase